MSKFLLLTFIAFGVVSLTLSHSAKPMVENNLAKTLLKSSPLIGDNPQRSLECFAIYMPKLNEATSRYEEKYAKCLQIAANSMAAIEAEVSEDRAGVNKASQEICNLITECSTQNSSQDFFTCHYKTSSWIIPTSYDIQNVSKARMQFIEIKSGLIMHEQTTCTDKCSDEYIQESGYLYAQLDACLAGLVLEPETTTQQIPSTTADSI